MCVCVCAHACVLRPAWNQSKKRDDEDPVRRREWRVVLPYWLMPVKNLQKQSEGRFIVLVNVDDLLTVRCRKCAF